jgi:hypothetical protein
VEPVVLRSRFVRWLCWISAVVALVLCVSVGAGRHPTTADYVLGTVFGVVMAAGFIRTAQLRVVLCDVGIVVHQYFRTKRIAWSEVQAVSIGYYGLRIDRTAGRSVTSASIFRSNWSSWTHRRSSADTWLDTVQAAVDAHRR